MQHPDNQSNIHEIFIFSQLLVFQSSRQMTVIDDEDTFLFSDHEYEFNEFLFVVVVIESKSVERSMPSSSLGEVYNFELSMTRFSSTFYFESLFLRCDFVFVANSSFKSNVQSMIRFTSSSERLHLFGISRAKTTKKSDRRRS